MVRHDRAALCIHRLQLLEVEAKLFLQQRARLQRSSGRGAAVAALLLAACSIGQRQHNGVAGRQRSHWQHMAEVAAGSCSCAPVSAPAAARLPVRPCSQESGSPAAALRTNVATPL